MTTQTRRGRAKGNRLPPQTCLCCSRPAKTRGLCATDYQNANRKVLEGEITWDALIAAGLALPSRRGQGVKPNAFLTKLAALKASQPKSPVTQLDLQKLLDR